MKTYCFFASHFLPYLGGVERYTYNMAKKLHENGNRVIIVTSEMEAQKQREITQGIEIIRTDAFFVMGERLPFYVPTRRNREIFRYLSQCGIDAVLINTKFYVLSLVAARFARKNRIPAVVIEHGTGHIAFDNKIVEAAGKAYEHLLARLVYKQCRNFAGVSKECCGYLSHFHIPAAGILYNAVDYEQIQSIKRQVSKSTGGRTIVYAGRCMKEKGVGVLAGAFDKLTKEFDDIHLLVIGDGKDLNCLREQYKGNDHIEFTGKLEFEDLIKRVAAADIFCFPTKYPEGLPTCMLEAMAAGLYSITSSCGGAKEVIADDSYGRIMDSCDEKAVMNELRTTLLMDGGERRKIAENGRRRVKEFFTWDNTVREMERIFEEICR